MAQFVCVEPVVQSFEVEWQLKVQWLILIHVEKYVFHSGQHV